MQEDNYKLNQKNGVLLGATATDSLIIDDREEHVLICSASGGGKQHGPMIGTLLSNKDSLLVTDIRGEYFAKTAGYRSQFSKIHVFDPFNATEHKDKVTINPLLDVTLGRKSIAQCTLLAKALINRSCLRNDIIDAACIWTRGLLLYLLHCEAPENKHFGYLNTLLNAGTHTYDNKFIGDALINCHSPVYNAPPDSRLMDMEKLEIEFKEIEAHIQGLGEQIRNTPSGLAREIISTIRSNLRPFLHPLLGGAQPTLSLRDFVNNANSQTLYLAAPPMDLAVVAPVFRAIIELCANLVLENEQRLQPNSATAPAAPQALTLLVDEATKLNYLTTIAENIHLFRHYHTRVVFTTQSLGMLHKIYGKSSLLFSHFGVKLFLTINDTSEAELIHQHIRGKVVDYTQGTPGKAQAVKAPEQLIAEFRLEREKENALLLIDGLPGLWIQRALLSGLSRAQRACANGVSSGASGRCAEIFLATNHAN